MSEFELKRPIIESEVSPILTAKIDAKATTTYVDGLIPNLKRGINVKDFGLIGDGVTNDSTALRIAINAQNLLASIPLGIDTTADGISDGWELALGSGQTATPTIESGYQKLEITAGTTANSSYITNTSSSYIPCTTGDTITAYVVGKKTGDVTFGIIIDWFNSSKNYVSQTGQTASSATTDTLISIAGIVPSGISYYRVRGCRINPNTSGALGAVWTKNVFTIRESISQSGMDVYFPDGTYNIASDIIFPSFVNIIMHRNAILKRTNGTNITINCSIDAGVYKIFDDDGTGTLNGNPKIKEVYPEWFGARANVAIDDYLPITKALDFAPKKVLLTNSIYMIGTKIVIPTYKSLEGTAYSMIYSALNIDMIELLTGSKLSDVEVRNEYATYTGSCVTLDGRNQVGFALIDRVKFRNVGTNRLNGTALMLKALSLPVSGTSCSLTRNKFSNIDIDAFEYAIKFDVPDVLPSDGVASCWINGNDFVNLYLMSSKWFIYMMGKDASTRCVDGNNLTNIQLQYASDGSTKGCYCQGNNNMFDNIQFWDMGSDYGHASGTDNAIQFTADASSNVVKCPPMYEIYFGSNRRFSNYINDSQKECNTFEIFDDFIYQTLTPANTPWLLYKGTDAQAATPYVSLDQRGKLVMTTGNNSGILAEDGSQLSCAIITQPGQTGFSMETRLRVLTNNTGISLNVGIVNANNALIEPFSISGSTVTNNATDAACFTYDDDATTKEWFATAVKSNVKDTGIANIGVAPSTTWQILKMVVSGGCDVIWFYVDGVLMKTLRVGITYAGGTNFYGIITANSTTTTSKTVEIDYVKIKHYR